MMETDEKRVLTAEDGMKYWAELAKSFGMPFAMCCAMMGGFWFIMQQMRTDYKEADDKHTEEVAEYKTEQKADKEKLIELTIQGNSAIDKMGDATQDVSKGLEALRAQGEQLEEAVNSLTKAVEKNE